MTEESFPGCVPEPSDGHVLLRAHREADLARIVEQSQDPLSRSWTTVPRPYDDRHAREWLAAIEASWNDPAGIRHWAITTAEDPDRYLGTVDLRPQSSRDVAKIGFGLHPEARGQGVMAAAVRLACQWWFDHGGSRVHWAAVRGNFDSWRVAWACGFTHHGTLPGAHVDMDGGPAMDIWQASLAADDVMEARTPWVDPPVLRTDDAGGLVLRAWRDSDVEGLGARDQPAHHMPARGVLDVDTFPEWLMARREKMAVGTTLSWCVADSAQDHALGEVLLFVTEGTLDDDTAELGYQVLPGARRRGVATAASRLVVAHAFTPAARGGLGMRRLVAQTAEDNLASAKVLEAVGFEVWGREAAADLLPDGRTVESVHWELLRG